MIPRAIRRVLIKDKVKHQHEYSEMPSPDILKQIAKRLKNSKSNDIIEF